MTDDCLIPFFTNLQSPLEPLFVAGEWFPKLPAIEIVVEFDTVMNTDVKPAYTSWLVEIDAVARDLGWTSWDDAKHLRLETVAGAQPAVDVTLELLVEDPNLKSWLSKRVQPFGPELIPAG